MFKKNIWKELLKIFEIKYYFDNFELGLWREGYRIKRIELENKENKNTVVVIDNK